MIRSGRSISGTQRTVTVLFALLMFSVPVRGQDLPIQGGRGGVAFRQQCGEHEYLVGFEARGMSWADAIRISCARHALPRYTVGPATAPLGFKGGSGGTLRTARCPSPAEAVAGIEIVVTGSRGTLSVNDDPQLVTGFHFWCGRLAPPHERNEQRYELLSAAHFLASGSSGVFSTGREVTFPVPQSCPAGTLAVGLQGRAGQYVDAVGLICGAAPTPVAAMGPSNPTRGRDLSKERAGGTVSARPPAPQTAAGAAASGRLSNPSSKTAATGTAAPPANPATPTAPEAAPESDPAVFANPTNRAGQRLNVCLELPNRQCGEPAARQFCEAQGHAAPVAFSTEVLRGESHTWSGTQCRSAQCEAFTSISCRTR
jgi:hypothetical protein